MSWRTNKVKENCHAHHTSISLMFSATLHLAIACLLVTMFTNRHASPNKRSHDLSVGVSFREVGEKDPTQKIKIAVDRGAFTLAPHITEMKAAKKPDRQAITETSEKAVANCIMADEQPLGRSGSSENLFHGSDADRSERGHGDISSARVFRDSPMLVNGDDVSVPYPERARQLMVEGIVRMRLTISEAGKVIDAQILSGPSFGLRNAALMVARRLFFLPATDDQGHAKTAKVDHEVVFRLNKRS